MNNWSVGSTYGRSNKKRTGGGINGMAIAITVTLLVVVGAVAVIAIKNGMKGDDRKDPEVAGQPSGGDDAGDAGSDGGDGGSVEQPEVPPYTPEGDGEEIGESISADKKGYLKIEQWGIAYKVPSGAKLVMYWLETSKSMNDTLNISMDEDGECSMGGVVVRSKNEKMDGAYSTKSAGEYYYHTVRAKKVCGDEKSDQMIWDMMQNPVKIVKE